MKRVPIAAGEKLKIHRIVDGTFVYHMTIVADADVAKAINTATTPAELELSRLPAAERVKVLSRFCGACGYQLPEHAGTCPSAEPRADA